MANTGTPGTATDTAAGTQPDALAATGIAPLIEASWMLERALRSLPDQRRVMRADTASTIAALEGRIEIIDGQLLEDTAVDPALLPLLWRDRVEAMSALYQVRYGQSQRFSY